jgi:hypothetical protein
MVPSRLHRTLLVVKRKVIRRVRSLKRVRNNDNDDDTAVIIHDGSAYRDCYWKKDISIRHRKRQMESYLFLTTKVESRKSNLPDIKIVNMYLGRAAVAIVKEVTKSSTITRTAIESDTTTTLNP